MGRRRTRAIVAATVTTMALTAGATARAADFSGGQAYFTTPIAAGAASDPHSDAWIAGLAAPAPYLNGPGNQFAPPVYTVDAQTPLRTVFCAYCGTYTGEGPTGYADRVQVPIPDGASPDPSSDGHIAFVDAGRGQEWDLIGASASGDGSWSARGAGHFALAGDGHQDNVLGGGSATASHLPLSQAISTNEVLNAIADGSFLIGHALSFGAPNVDGRCWVYPALGSDGRTSGAFPEGARIQLDPSFDVSTLAPAARVIARTLQVYGAYLRDLSGAFVFYAREPRGLDLPWAAATLTGDSLSGIPTNRFRVLSADYTTRGTSQPFVQRPASSCGPGATDVEPDHSADGRPGVLGSSPPPPTDTTPATTPPERTPLGTVSRTPKAPRALRATVRGRRVQLVWNATESGRRYRVYLDARLKLTTAKTYTSQLKLKPGRHRAYVRAMSTGGTAGGKTATIAFTVR